MRPSPTAAGPAPASPAAARPSAPARRRAPNASWSPPTVDQIARIFPLDPSADAAPSGRESRDWIRAQLSALADLRVEITGLAAVDELVAVDWAATGTHAALFLGYPPTGRRLVVTGTHYIRLRDGDPVQHWSLWDFPALLRQLG